MTRRQQPIVEDSAVLSASSTPYFTLLFWALFALKIYQYYQHVIAIGILFVIYHLIKYSLIKIYHLLIRQPSVVAFWNEMIEFLRARCVYWIIVRKYSFQCRIDF